MLEKIDFEVDGLFYRVYMDDKNGGIAFSLLGGATKKGKVKLDPFWSGPNENDEEPGNTSDVNLTSNPFKVFNQVKNIVIDWIFRKWPVMFFFEATTDRKVRIYRRIIGKELEQILKYYNCYETAPGNFAFYFKRHF